MHLLFAAVTLASFLLGIIEAEVSPDPYSVKVDYGALLNSGVPKKDLCDYYAVKDKNCIKSSSLTAIPGCSNVSNATDLVLDTFSCCRVCPKQPRGICGGWLYKHGRCENGHECLHEILSRSDFIRKMGPDGQQDAPTGKCIPADARLACREKNCCERTMSSKTLTCGSDGHWYPNKCFLYKANCFRNISTPEITRIKKNTTGVCGPPPTAEELCPTRTIAACLTFFNENSPPIKLYYDTKTDKPACVTRSTNPDTAAAVKSPSTSPAPPEGA
uniref:Kazal-like domain-containing protein n=1 Tax=Amphimedon queenslandica TaxID=400682 RepID=A0A1X7UZ26_AMPQE